MNPKIAVGTAFAASPLIINTAASTIGVAKTGTAIGTLSGAAHTSATAAWIGLGSMKFGMFVMGALPAVGVLLLLDSLSGPESGSPIIDWYEEGWRRYELEHELEGLKQQVEVDRDHQLRAKVQAISLAQQEAQFRSLEVEHELYLMKKEISIAQRPIAVKAQPPAPRTLTKMEYHSFNVCNTPNIGLKVMINATGVIGSIVSEFFHTKSYQHMLEIQPVSSQHSTYAAFSAVSLVS